MHSFSMVTVLYDNFVKYLYFRGSELINLMLFKRVEEHRMAEMSSLEKIRKKMEKIKLRQYRLNPQSSITSNDHYVGRCNVLDD